ncbi:MAG: 5-(carboxyamino)imidazole ribonucleotide synthase [Gemmatimonadetes bacterium]|nr:5-(carboxyamino)imidazole ribonucleotide synthase [Gemmatimonadota bacterium]
MTAPILPGATLGVIGGGQLGRMFTLAARRMGYRVTVLAPEDDTPAGQIAYQEIRAPYEDLDAVRRFASSVSVVTFEFENVPAQTAVAAAEHAPVRPAGSLLHTTQHRRREKEALRSAGIPTVPFAAVESEAELIAAVAAIGTPAILKTAAWGYDGKGQVRLGQATEAASAWESLGRAPAVLEAVASFEREVSVVGARGVDGSVALYEPVDNTHVHHILDLSVAPAELPAGVVARAQAIVRTLLEAWEVVGVICVELFVMPDGELVVNEVAPRPHNSGHLTIDAHVTSQFEQQVRVVCALPLGSTAAVAPAAMANLLGDLWEGGDPNWPGALAVPGVALHLYGKLEARPGRKMGHLTALGATAAEARERVLRARAAAAAALSGRVPGRWPARSAPRT